MQPSATRQSPACCECYINNLLDSLPSSHCWLFQEKWWRRGRLSVTQRSAENCPLKLPTQETHLESTHGRLGRLEISWLPRYLKLFVGDPSRVSLCGCSPGSTGGRGHSGGQRLIPDPLEQDTEPRIAPDASSLGCIYLPLLIGYCSISA